MLMSCVQHVYHAQRACAAACGGYSAANSGSETTKDLHTNFFVDLADHPFSDGVAHGRHLDCDFCQWQG